MSGENRFTDRRGLMRDTVRGISAASEGLLQQFFKTRSIQTQANHLSGWAAGKTAVNEAIAVFPRKKFFPLYCS